MVQKIAPYKLYLKIETINNSYATIHYITGEQHDLFKKAEINDRIITMYPLGLTSDGRARYSGQVTINRHTGVINGSIKFTSLSKNGYNVPIYIMRDSINGTCRPYVPKKSFN